MNCSGGLGLGDNVVWQVEKLDHHALFAQVLEEHDFFCLGSDVFFTSLVNNDLFRLRLRLAHASHISREEYQEVEALFLRGTFPEEILESFREVLDSFGHAPIIIHSISLLEDSTGRRHTSIRPG
jgi:pyruvate, water dikinase